MVGFTVFKLWVAFTQHYTKKNFDIFQNKGKMKGKYETYLARKDYQSFERLASKLDDAKQAVQYMAANFIYGNTSAIWDQESGFSNYNMFVLRQTSLTEVIRNDLTTFELYGIIPTDIQGMLRLLTQNLITIETIIVMNSYIPICETMRNSSYGSMLEPLLLRIEKSIKFFKVNQNISDLINNFLNGKNNNV